MDGASKNAPVQYPHVSCMPFSTLSLSIVSLSLCLSSTVYSVFSQPWLRRESWERLRMQLQRATLCRIFQADSRGRPGTSLFPGVQNTMQSKTCLIFRQERLLSPSSFFIFCSFVPFALGNGHTPCPSFDATFRYNESEMEKQI